jgi:phage terminase large subunit-like protein
VVVPAGIMSTGFPAVEKTCREFGDEFDRWQAELNRLLLAKREDGLYAARHVAAMSIPRQTGKTWDVGRVVFALCIINPGLSVVWTAHRTKVAYKTFQEQRKLALSRKMAGHIDQRPGKGIKTGAGDRSITFLNGSSIEFAAREKAIRGFGDVDVLVIDEGQLLSQSALEDMIPTMNVARNPLVILMGTPPRKKDGELGEAFRRIRRRALSGESSDVLYIEFSADPGSDPADERARRKANPSYPHRTGPDAMGRMLEWLGLEGFLREAFGIWDEDEDAGGTIDLAQWVRLRDPSAPAPETATLVVDVAPDRSYSSIGVASGYGEKTLVMGQRFTGTAGVVDAVVALKEKRNILEVALNPSSQAGALVADFAAAGVELELLTTREMGAACAAFQQGIHDGRYVHLDQDEFNAAAANAKTRMSGEVEVWDRRDWSIDITMLVAGSTAAYRWTKRPKRRKATIVAGRRAG